MPMIEDDNEIRTLLANTHRVAMIGLSSNTARPSHGVAQALQRAGYDVVPVNPNEDEVLGQKAVADLAQAPGGIDVVDVFRQPKAVPEIVDACIELEVPALWLQEGVIHAAAAQRAVDAGIDVVMDRCILKELRRLLS